MIDENTLTDQQAEEDYEKRFHKASMSSEAMRFRTHDKKLFKTHYATGFKALDEALDGGFTEGLHALGAVTSLGKSTFCLQIAAHLASQGIPVIYYSLEMSRTDLAAKLISRQLYIDHPGDPLIRDKTSSFLMSEKHMSSVSHREQEMIDKAAEEVSHSIGLMKVMQRSSGPITVKEIEEDVKCFCRVQAPNPFVIIDYLGILGRPDRLTNAPDKQVCDYNIMHLKILADSLHIPVLLISSFNRAGYDVPVSKTSFKDSGNIEYTCDVLLGLQLKGVGETNFDVSEALSAIPREEELVILKQRYGSTGRKISYKFYAPWSIFQEVDEGAFKPASRALQRQLSLAGLVDKDARKKGSHSDSTAGVNSSGKVVQRTFY